MAAQFIKRFDSSSRAQLISVPASTSTEWSHKISGVTAGKVGGVSVDDISKINRVES